MNREKVIRFLTDYQKILRTDDIQSLFFIAICQVQLGDYAEAQRLFEKSFLDMFKPPKLWYGTNQPNWLVDICFLSNRTDLLPDVQREFGLFKQKFDTGYGLVAHYAFSLVELHLPSGWDIADSIQELLKRPKIKDMHAIGKTLLAIIASDPPALEAALSALLKAHKGMAKFGALRETAEGLLCMPAMSLARTAIERGLPVEIENDYYSNGYLQFLMKQDEH